MPQVVRLAEPAPRKLAKLATEAGMEPEDFLVETLSTYSSITEAAMEIDVDRKTLRLWLRRYGIQVERGQPVTQ